MIRLSQQVENGFFNQTTRKCYLLQNGTDMFFFIYSDFATYTTSTHCIVNVPYVTSSVAEPDPQREISFWVEPEPYHDAALCSILMLNIFLDF
jgi:hypothetical protein